MTEPAKEEDTMERADDGSKNEDDGSREEETEILSIEDTAQPTKTVPPGDNMTPAAQEKAGENFHSLLASTNEATVTTGESPLSGKPASGSPRASPPTTQTTNAATNESSQRAETGVAEAARDVKDISKATKTPLPQDYMATTTAAVEAGEEDQDETMTNNAARALAAVAAAATANHLSPSEQAQAARAVAPTIVPEAAISALPMETGSQGNKRQVIMVKGSAVKECLQRRFESAAKAHAEEAGEALTAWTGDEYPVGHRLAKGENDSFLQYLLLLEYFVTADEVRPGSVSNLSTPEKLVLSVAAVSVEEPDAKPPGKDPHEQDRTLAASEKVRSMLSMTEEAYDGMLALLPTIPASRERLDTESSDLEYYGIGTGPPIPDLLPPCTSATGDATLQFFRACNGESPDGSSSARKKKDIVDEAAVQDETATVSTASTDETTTDEKANTASSPNGFATARSSVFSNMFSSMRSKASPASTVHAQPHATRASFNGIFKRRSVAEAQQPEPKHKVESQLDDNALEFDYVVTIDREMLGLTVENVLERTVVRTVLPGGAAKKAGAKVGSLIVKVGNVETKHLTHFETIDELRQSQRPLKLALRPISADSLRAAREEMGRLIRGGGFGASLSHVEPTGDVDVDGNSSPRRAPNKVERFSQILHQRWSVGGSRLTKKEESLLEAGEKLVWILTLLTIGLEREAASLAGRIDPEASMDFSSPKRSSYSSQTAEDYADAARSVAKVLYDFVNPQLTHSPGHPQPAPTQGIINESQFPPHIAAARKKKGPPQPAAPKGKGPKGAASEILHRIGDVLHRTMSFLADPSSPPAALLRGEVVAFLCDILDIDSEMELSEEEALSQTSSGDAGPINDLGPAGSLLKLIILNCSMMRSPECARLSEKVYDDGQLEEEQRRRFGLKKQMSGLDLHRFHAGNRFLAVVHRLAASRSISARVTACSLGPVLWGHLDFPHQLQLRGVITRALHDVDVIVRKATATVLHEIAELVFDSRAVPWLVLMCERAMTDPEPQLRAAAMTLTWHLAEHLPNAFLGDASQGSRSLRRLPPRTDPTFAEVYLLQCKLLPVATRLAEDRAASVRIAVAAQCDRLCNALGDHWYNIIVDVLQALFSDADERVRGEAILCFPRLAEIVLVAPPVDGMAPVGISILEALLPVAIKLQKDASVNVRSSLATSAGELLTLLHGLQSLEEITHQARLSSLDSSSPTASGYKKYVDETLIPLLQQLLHDADPEVTSTALRAVTNASRGNVREIQGRKMSTATEDDTVSLSSLASHASSAGAEARKDPVFIPVLSEAQVLRLLPTLSGLATSRQWRVRQGAVEIVPALLGCTHKLETRSEIAQLCFRLMSDRVDAVRRTAAECLCVGGGGLGSHDGSTGTEWMVAIVIPHVRHCCKSQDSKQRILALKMIEVILINGVCPPKPKGSSSNVTPQRELVDVAMSLSGDPIANVRLNVGRTFSNLVGTVPFEEDELSVIHQKLQDQVDAEQTREVSDRDVVWFARGAMKRAYQARESIMEPPSSSDVASMGASSQE